MNSILLQSALEKLGVQTRVQSAFSMPEVAEPYSRQRAIRHLEKGRVVIFGGIGAGTGNPLFSTDTAAALRASESKFLKLTGRVLLLFLHLLGRKLTHFFGPVHADAVLKGTNVDGVFVCDPGNNNSVAAEHISFGEWSTIGTPPMDTMAVRFCEDNGISG